jgi:L-lactate utilization protein LutC
MFCSLMSRTPDIEVSDLWGWHGPTITDFEAGIV